MADKHTDIVIIGAGIAGLWTFNRLKRLGYDVLLLEKDSIGCGQTIASQGIIHSGLKYAFAGKINKLAQSISAMPDLWRNALAGKGPVDLSAARMNAGSQYLLIPSGFMGGLVKLVTRQALGGNVHEIAQKDWPEDIKNSGFRGSVIYMDEPVLDIPSALHALAEPYKDCIRKIEDSESPQDFLQRHNITAKKIIYTAATTNHIAAIQNKDEAGLKTQKRPLLMGMLKPAPFPLYAHLVGSSDKPVATITTHQCKDGTLIWYLGGNVAERGKEVPEIEMIRAAQKGFERYLPRIDLSSVSWASLPIDRVEGSSTTQGWMPDTPTIHEAGDSFYCWPTKLTFAPLLSDYILEKLERDNIKPSTIATDWSFLPEVNYATTPWDKAEFTTATQ